MASLSALSTIAGIGGTILSAVGSIAQGNAAAASAEYEAQQRERQASDARAIAQREALERRKEQRLLQSSQLASAAASGGASDPSVVDIFADTAEQGQLNVETEIYKGEARAAGLQDAANISRFEGQQARTAGFIGAGSSILGGASNMFSNFGTSNRPTSSSSGYYYG